MRVWYQKVKLSVTSSISIIRNWRLLWVCMRSPRRILIRAMGIQWVLGIGTSYYIDPNIRSSDFPLEFWFSYFCDINNINRTSGSLIRWISGLFFYRYEVLDFLIGTLTLSVRPLIFHPLCL